MKYKQKSDNYSWKYRMTHPTKKKVKKKLNKMKRKFKS